MTMSNSVVEISTIDASVKGQPYMRAGHSANKLENLVVRADTVGRSLWGKSYSSSAFHACSLQLLLHLEPEISSDQIYDNTPQCDVFDEVSLIKTMSNHGYTFQKVKMTPVDVDPRLLPCVFIPKNNQSGYASPKVILPAQTGNGRGTSIFDPETGDVTEYDRSDVFANGQGVAYLFRKIDKNEIATSKQKRSQTGHTWFRAVVGRFSSLIAQLISISLLLNVTALASPLFIMLVYDRVISPQTTEFLPILAAGVGLALILELCLRLLRSRLIAWVTARSYYIVGTEVFQKIIGLPHIVASRASVTAQLARIKSFESIREFFAGPIFASILEFPAIVLTIFVLLFFSPVLAVIPLAILLAFAVIFLILQRIVSTSIKHAASEAAVAQKFCIETFQEQEQIRVNGLSDIWKEKFRDISGRENWAMAHLNFLGSVGENLGYFVVVSAGLTTLMVGVGLVWEGEITTGMLVASMILILKATAPLHNLCSSLPRLEQFKNSLRQINSLMDLESEVEQRKASARIPQLSGRLEFENVALRHTRQSGPLFVGLNAKINSGDVVAILGASGTGKSSLINLIQAMYQPQLGRICIDGFNIQQLVAEDLRRQIGYIPQDPKIIYGSIADYLRYSRPDASDEMMWSALKFASAKEIVKSMPDGLDQLLDGSSNIDRKEFLFQLALARVVLQDAPLILVDEIPNTVLNSGFEKVFERFLAMNRGKKTVLFVSQRVDHMRIADKVIALRRGSAPVVGPLDKVLEMSA